MGEAQTAAGKLGLNVISLEIRRAEYIRGVVLRRSTCLLLLTIIGDPDGVILPVDPLVVGSYRVITQPF